MPSSISLTGMSKLRVSVTMASKLSLLISSAKNAPATTEAISGKFLSAISSKNATGS